MFPRLPKRRVVDRERQQRQGGRGELFPHWSHNNVNHGIVRNAILHCRNDSLDYTPLKSKTLEDPNARSVLFFTLDVSGREGEVCCSADTTQWIGRILKG